MFMALDWQLSDSSISVIWLWLVSLRLPTNSMEARMNLFPWVSYDNYSSLSNPKRNTLSGSGEGFRVQV